MWLGLRTLLSSTLISYFITKYCRTSPFMPWVNFAFVMGHLLLNHLEEQFFAEDLDFVNVIGITGAQMVLCMKLSSFGWNVYDGSLKQETLTDFQRDRAVKEHPPLIDFLAYAFFFPSLLTGPSYDYNEFQRWIDLSMFDSIGKSDEQTKKRRKRKIPRSGHVATLKLLEGIFWIVLWTQVTARFVNLETAQSKDFMTKYSFIGRCFYLYALGFTYRLKYYGAWAISEGACILSGLGFNGKVGGKYKWDRVRNVNPWRFETGQNTFTLLESWNMNTSKWLKNYVYLRVTPKGKKPGFKSTVATFITSAMWHGTRPGYYLTFITGSLFQSLGKTFRRNIRPIFLQADGVSPGPYKPLYDVVCFLVTQLAFGFAVQPFVLLDLKPSLEIWSTVYFFVFIFIAIFWFLFHGPYKKFVIRTLKAYHPKKVDTKDDRENSIPLGVPQPAVD